jgi:hypothetical protein
MSANQTHMLIKVPMPYIDAMNAQWPREKLHITTAQARVSECIVAGMMAMGIIEEPMKGSPDEDE